MKTHDTILDCIVSHCDDIQFLKADGFDSACIGYDCKTEKLIYSTKKCLDILVADGMSLHEALKHFDLNVLNAYVGEKTPIFLMKDEW